MKISVPSRLTEEVSYDEFCKRLLHEPLPAPKYVIKEVVDYAITGTEHTPALVVGTLRGSTHEWLYTVLFLDPKAPRDVEKHTVREDHLSKWTSR